MSEAAPLVDAVLAHLVTVIPTVTTRNTITNGFMPESAQSMYPWCQGGFGTTLESSPEESGQRGDLWTLQFLLLTDSNQGDQSWSDIDELRLLIHNDYTLGGLVTRAQVTDAVVDEISDNARTSTAFVVEAAKF